MPSKSFPTRYPPSVYVYNNMIHKVMILLGEINGIETFYDKNFSLVEFRRVEEAQCAKEGLHGQLFNYSRITIEFLSNSTNTNHGPLLPYACFTLLLHDKKITVMQEFLLDNTILAMTIYGVALSPRMKHLCVVSTSLAQTRLDKLTNHYSNVVGRFKIVFLYIDTINDFASYVVFLRYLSSRDCVGVAKLYD
ncbi:hypothetical protein H5410_030876 [Solanum commersonii]|uniref:Uncharacterized protein n=1 Tax=Solanum commersonii TaxID=4109 RepID=A0A9J5YGU2_SOLCO|nr:hypothetical protein H5410_030876 [Solanum commersonii]